MRERAEREDDGAPDRQEMLAYLHGGQMGLNYMMDKGWLQALDHFAECILTGRTPETATAADAWRASQLGHAAIRSRQTGQITRL